MKKIIMIAGGGTGGHIYPGIAIARALQKQDPEVEIHFVGTSEGLEVKIIPKEGFPLHLIKGGKLNFSGHLIRKLKTLFSLPYGFLQSIQLLLRTQPFFVLGVGGYASGPFVLAAALMGKKTAIWEPNALPGLTNRWLSRFVKRCFLVFEESKAHLPFTEALVLGMPVRAEMEISQTNPSSREDSRFHLLHIGGSQGSRAIGRCLWETLQSRGIWTQGLKVVHQTGALDHQDFLKKYQGFDDLVEVHEFIYDMSRFYQWADLVVCRGGAGTLTELAAFGLPALIVPLPAADAHQEKNAESLVREGAARMILQKDLTPDRLIQEIQNLREQPEELQKLSSRIRRFHRPKAAEAIAKSILES